MGPGGDWSPISCAPYINEQARVAIYIRKTHTRKFGNGEINI